MTDDFILPYKKDNSQQIQSNSVQDGEGKLFRDCSDTHKAELTSPADTQTPLKSPNLSMQDKNGVALLKGTEFISHSGENVPLSDKRVLGRVIRCNSTHFFYPEEDVRSAVRRLMDVSFSNDGKSNDYITGYSDCFWMYYGLIKEVFGTQLTNGGEDE